MAAEDELIPVVGSPADDSLVSDEEVSLAEESADLAEPIEPVSALSATVSDFPELQNRNIGETLQLQISDISDDGGFSLVLVEDEVPEEAPGELLPGPEETQLLPEETLGGSLA